MTFSEFKKAEHIRPLMLPDKEKYYLDLQNIERSWSGRMDLLSLGNTFILEAEQLLINAIELFEMGYFDCAYYSLRTAVDVSTTIVFLADMPQEEREVQLSKWKGPDNFPMQRQMIEKLFQNGDAFVDMKNKMPAFFENAKTLSAELNKYVHKQGFQHFYVSRNHFLNLHKSPDNFISCFADYFKKCTGVVAVMRLALDPFPVLLMDKDILYRCYDSLTEPYSEEFVAEYIGQESLDSYKKTARYVGMYEYLMSLEEKNEYVFDVVKNQYIDSHQKEAILSQAHLMTKWDIVSSLLVFACEKVTKVYIENGLDQYFTDRKSNRQSWAYSSQDFLNFAKAPTPLNQAYGKAFISVFRFQNEVYSLEHNTPLTDNDVACVENAFIEAEIYLEQALSDNS